MPFTLFIFALPAMIFFLRFLMQFTGCDYYYPLCRTIASITSPFLRATNAISFLKTRNNVHYGALLWTFLLGEIGYGSYFVFFGKNFAFDFASIVFILVVSFIFTIWAIINLLFYLLLPCAILSWFPSMASWSLLFRQLTSPIIAPLDRFIPPIGGISLSFMVGFFLMSFVNYSAMPFVLYKFINLLVGIL